MKTNIAVIASVLGATAFSTGTMAQDATRPMRTVTLAFANELAAATLKKCAADGYNVAVAVVDRAGQLLTLQRSELARAHAIELAQRKAYTSAMLGYETVKLVENIKNGVTPPSISQTTGFTALIGGLPLKSKDEVIGGIGVSGAPGGQFDQACADTAVTALQSKL